MVKRFRLMTANLLNGKADAGNLARSGQELPEDLDIWVNEGYENL